MRRSNKLLQQQQLGQPQKKDMNVFRLLSYLPSCIVGWLCRNLICCCKKLIRQMGDAKSQRTSENSVYAEVEYTFSFLFFAVQKSTTSAQQIFSKEELYICVCVCVCVCVTVGLATKYRAFSSLYKVYCLEPNHLLSVHSTVTRVSNLGRTRKE
jgi:hypothetical protein